MPAPVRVVRLGTGSWLPVSRSFAALAAEESRLRAVVTDFDEESERQLSTNRLQDVNLVGPPRQY